MKNQVIILALILTAGGGLLFTGGVVAGLYVSRTEGDANGYYGIDMETGNRVWYSMPEEMPAMSDTFGMALVGRTIGPVDTIWVGYRPVRHK